MFVTAQNLTHQERGETFSRAKQKLVSRIKERGDLPYVSIQTQLELLDELSEFEFGQFLIERGGLNGYWTHYVVQHPNRTDNFELHPLEAFILNSSPMALATQERFQIFKKAIQERIFEGGTFASIPSGVMGDLLDLDYAGFKDFALVGLDLDEESLKLAKSYAEEKKLIDHCSFSEADAWELNRVEEFDLIASNGLTIYEPDDERVTSLYKEFYKALRPGGTLVSSFLTPPPAPELETEWKLDEVNKQHALLQKILLADILDMKLSNYRSEALVRRQLEEANFSKIEVIYDRAHIFPTAIAIK